NSFGVRARQAVRGSNPQAASRLTRNRVTVGHCAQIVPLIGNRRTTRCAILKRRTAEIREATLGFRRPPRRAPRPRARAVLRRTAPSTLGALLARGAVGEGAEPARRGRRRHA